MIQQEGEIMMKKEQALLVILTLTCFIIGCSTTETEEEVTINGTPIEEKTTIGKITIPLGQTFKLIHDEKEVLEIAVTDVTLTDARNEFNEAVDNVAIVTIEAINISDEVVLLNEYYFHFYDETGKRLDLYPMSGYDLDLEFSSYAAIAPGRRRTIKINVGITTGDILKIDVAHNTEDEPFATIDTETVVETIFESSLVTASYLDELELGTPFTVLAQFSEEPFEINIKSIALTDERNEYMESEMPDRAVETVAIITIEGKNIGTKREALCDSNFLIYDETGNGVTLYPLITTNKSVEWVEPGQTALIDIVIDIKTGSNFDIEVRDKVTNTKTFAIYKYRN